MIKTWRVVAIAGLLCSLCSLSYSQQRYNQGVGFRAGDPFGISYKLKLRERRYIEGLFGTTSASWYSSYYINRFDNKSSFDGFQYGSHKVNLTLIADVRYLIHESFPARVEGYLDWYYGFGFQVRYSSVDYRFFRPVNGGQVLDIAGDNNVDIGPEAIIGSEYQIPGYPITAFADASMYMELLDNPFRFKLLWGIGIRYNF